MTISKLRSVILPSGECVELSDTPLPWWSTHNATGYLSPKLFAPNPTQPRKHMTPSELSELTMSVSAAGVREPLTVTPRHLVPWVILESEWDHCQFVTVSGHRRALTAIIAEVEAVPVRIRVYATQNEFREETILLNAQRVDLSPLEEGLQVAELLEINGGNLNEVARKLGKNTVWVSGRLALSRLNPEIQKLIDPTRAAKDRLPIVLAEKIGKVESPSIPEIEHVAETHDLTEMIVDVELETLEDNEKRFLLQDILLRVALKDAGSAVRMSGAIHKIVIGLDSYRGGGANRHSRTVRPDKKREQIGNFVNTVTESALANWPKEEWDRILYNLDRRDVDVILNNLDEAVGTVLKMKQHVLRVLDEKQKRPHATDSMIRCDYRAKDRSIVRNGIIPTIGRYVELWKTGNLGFQIEGKPKPPNLPTLEEAIASMRQLEAAE